MTAQAPALTPRMEQIMRHVSRGETTPEIAGALSCSEASVKHHLTEIYRRLGVTNRVSAALLWRDWRDADQKEEVSKK